MLLLCRLDTLPSVYVFFLDVTLFTIMEFVSLLSWFVYF